MCDTTVLPAAVMHSCRPLGQSPVRGVRGIAGYPRAASPGLSSVTAGVAGWRRRWQSKVSSSPAQEQRQRLVALCSFQSLRKSLPMDSRGCKVWSYITHLLVV